MFEKCGTDLMYYIRIQELIFLYNVLKLKIVRRPDVVNETDISDIDPDWRIRTSPDV